MRALPHRRSTGSPGARLLGAAVLFLLLGVANADEQTRRLQEELRKRNLYFGDVDGRRTPALEAALHEYQHHKGIPVTGDYAAQTLASLGIAVAPDHETAAPWPEAPVLRSDVARGGAAEGVVEPSPAPLEPPPPIAEAALPAEALGGNDPPEPGPGKPVEEPPPPALAPPPPPAPEPPLPPAPPAKPTPAQVEQMARFLRSYLTACESNQLEREMAFYADPLRYFENGIVTRQFVERDVQRYYKRWPHRKYTLLDLKVALAPGDAHEFFVRFRIRFNVEGEHGRAAGMTDNLFRVRSEGDGLKMVALQENRVRS